MLSPGTNPSPCAVRNKLGIDFDEFGEGPLRERPTLSRCNLGVRLRVHVADGFWIRIRVGVRVKDRVRVGVWLESVEKSVDPLKVVLGLGLGLGFG